MNNQTANYIYITRVESQMKRSKTIGGYKRKQNKCTNQNREQKRDIRSQEITTMIGLKKYKFVYFVCIVSNSKIKLL